jgi:hypothetical protein
MRFAITLAVGVTTLTSIPLLAQQTDATAPDSDSAKVTYAPTSGGFGDLAASRAYEMSPVTGELEGKLDSKTAKRGDPVVLKTAEKVQTSDGTVIPRGARLVGHVTEVQPYELERGPARIAIAFDHAELKNGQNIAVHTLIRGVATSVAALTVRQENDDGMMGMPVPTGSMANGGRMGPGYGGIAPANGPGLATSQIDRASDAAAASESNRVDANSGSTGSATMPGDGLNADRGAHGVAAARAITHPTAIPGVMLAGNSSSSGVLLAYAKDIQFESGTEIQLGVVADR